MLADDYCSVTITPKISFISQGTSDRVDVFKFIRNILNYDMIKQKLLMGGFFHTGKPDFL